MLSRKCYIQIKLLSETDKLVGCLDGTSLIHYWPWSFKLQSLASDRGSFVSVWRRLLHAVPTVNREESAIAQAKTSYSTEGLGH